MLSLKGHQLLFVWLLKGVSVQARVRWCVALTMVAIGVMLAVAIHTVNHSALASFGQALDTVNGQASAQLVAPLGDIDDSQIDVWDSRRADLGIRSISPVLVVRTDRLTVLGLDFFKAAFVSASLMPSGADGATDIFNAKALFLSVAALNALNVRVGDSIVLQHGPESVSLVVAGEVPGAASQVIGVMDIGSAQWAFNRIGVVSRLDLRLEDGQTPQGLRAALQAQSETLQVVAMQDRDRRMSLLSRAYRVNLSVLAMVALLTGGFLLSTAVNLSIVRQRSELALLGVLGASETWLRRFVWAQGGLIGALGGMLGVGMGLLLAAVLMHWFGGDLGGNYFAKSQTQLVIDWMAMAVLALAATLMGLASAWLPLMQINWRQPMAVLRAGQAETLLFTKPTLKWSLMAVSLSMGLLLLPTLDELPWAAYGSIAALLCAGLLAMPWVLAQLWGGLSRALMHSHALVHSRVPAVCRLAVWRLAQAPAAATPLITGTVAAFSLTVAMMVMVSSFRTSVSDWLGMVLPADLYTSSQAMADQPGFDAKVQALIAAVPQVQRVETSRQRSLRLAHDRPEVMLVAKPLNLQDPMQSVALVGLARLPPEDGQNRLTVFGSEAMADVYGWRAGQEASLPLTAQGEQRVWVGGLFRDYGRQHGTVVMSTPDYERLTGDRSLSSVSVWVVNGADPAQVMAQIQARVQAQMPELAQLKWISASDVRQLSLQIFDRSFAMTYALEAAALFVALFSVAAGVTGQLILRRREFGVLAHLGMSEQDRWRLVSLEVGLLLVVAVVWATFLGVLMSQILIHKVNPESFHWTMSTHFAVGQWALISGLLLAIGVLTARWAARQGLDPRRLAESLRADW
ncbi:FtsX-like permease family protein [Limnohabitans sp. Rim8]|uniref:ABC transporter permease n=1 Tax=Limnohabitans sp. Rim8 TaxID=1100718 RepID=UPI0026206B70|nr:FtsX-like permease family protein [Limnohabitans sp. Rim8]